MLIALGIDNPQMRQHQRCVLMVHQALQLLTAPLTVHLMLTGVEGDHVNLTTVVHFFPLTFVLS